MDSPRVVRFLTTVADYLRFVNDAETPRRSDTLLRSSYSIGRRLELRIFIDKHLDTFPLYRWGN